MNDEGRSEWIKTMIERGHTPIMDDVVDPHVDIFVTNNGIHNGPGCATCGWTTCWHCTPVEKIPECTSKKDT